MSCMQLRGNKWGSERKWEQVMRDHSSSSISFCILDVLYREMLFQLVFCARTGDWLFHDHGDFGDERRWGDFVICTVLLSLSLQACHLLKSCCEIIPSKVSRISSLSLYFYKMRQMKWSQAVKFRLWMTKYLVNNYKNVGCSSQSPVWTALMNNVIICM